MAHATFGPGTRVRLGKAIRWIVAVCAILAIADALWSLESATRDLTITRERVGVTPVTVFRPQSNIHPGAAPVVLIAHGFAGSQQLMQPFAQTLARNGYVAITFDFPGHGRNPAPMWGGLTDQERSHRTLLASMEEMGAYARSLAGAAGRYAVIGHSMASDIVVRHAQAHREVEATVAVSLFAPSIVASTPADSPRNLLVIDGDLEPSVLTKEALRVVAQGRGGAAMGETQPGVTYGNFEAGNARRAELSPGVEHIGVLYSAHTQAATLAWLDTAFGKPAPVAPFVDARGPLLGLLLAGVMALAWPLARLLPRLSALAPPAVRMRWRAFLPFALLPALLTPLLLWKAPVDFMPILLGDYLMLHFGLYGLLTGAGLLLARRAPPGLPAARGGALAIVAILATGYAIFAVGVPIDHYVFNLRPEAARLPLVLALCAGTLPYFLADEWLTRDPGAPPLAYFATKLAFLVSLVLAILLNVGKLFFLALIVPAILLMLIVYGLFSRWIFRSTGHPAVGAVANALAFGCFIAATFPLVY